MRVFTVCSGISAVTVAAKGLPITFVGYADIGRFPSWVLHHRCGAGRPVYMPDPDAPGLSAKESSARRLAIKDVARIPEGGSLKNWGDFTRITDDDLRSLGPVDLLEGGPPCQDFSLSGERGGLDGARGGLTLAFYEFALRMREINGLRYALFENVPGVLSDRTNAFGHLLAGLVGEQGGPVLPPRTGWTNAGAVAGPLGEVAWRVLDGRYRGLAQRRKRVWALADFGAGRAGEVLFERGVGAGHPEQGAGGKQASPAALPGGAGLADGEVEFHVHPEVAATLTANGGGVLRAAGQANEHDYVVVSAVMPKDAVRPEGHGGIVDWVLRNVVRWKVRRLTPVECERL